MCGTGLSRQRRRPAPVLPVPPRQGQIPQADQGAGGEERRAPHRDGPQGGQAGHPGVPPPPALQRHRLGPGRNLKCFTLYFFFWLVFIRFFFRQSLPRDLPPTIIPSGEELKSLQGQSELSSDESPEDRFLSDEPRLRRRLNLKAGVSCCTHTLPLMSPPVWGNENTEVKLQIVKAFRRCCI